MYFEWARNPAAQNRALSEARSRNSNSTRPQIISHYQSSWTKCCRNCDENQRTNSEGKGHRFSIFLWLLPSVFLFLKYSLVPRTTKILIHNLNQHTYILNCSKIFSESWKITTRLHFLKIFIFFIYWLIKILYKWALCYNTCINVTSNSLAVDVILQYYSVKCESN